MTYQRVEKIAIHRTEPGNVLVIDSERTWAVTLEGEWRDEQILTLVEIANDFYNEGFEEGEACERLVAQAKEDMK